MPKTHLEELKHILVPTDFSAPAEHAVEVALNMARDLGAKVTLVHVFVTPPAAYMGYGEGLAWPVDQLEVRAQEALDAAVVEARKKYPHVGSVFTSGDAWEQIIEVAKEKGADLIVMATHGRRGLARALLGSTAEKVVRLSPVPVLTCQLARKSA